MIKFNLSFKSLGESALLIEWPAEINEQILEDIISLQAKIETSLRDYLIETVNAYNSLTLIYNADLISFHSLQEQVQELYSSLTRTANPQTYLWKIPVCYDEEFGIDLKEMALAKNMSIKNIIEKHCEPIYTVYFLGFLPGFLYLGGLPEILHFSRRATPRIKIQQGAVAIGGHQTGIYPLESPGGWNILGNSPLTYFNVDQNPPCFAKAGDKLRFYSIDRKRYNEVKKLVDNGQYEPESELL